MKKIFSLLCALAAAPALAAQPESIMIDNAYVRPVSPDTKTAAVYLTIVNHGPDNRLLAAQTPVAATELHRTEIINEIMKMREVEGGIALPAHSATEFAPNGLHIMLLDIRKPLHAGTAFPMTLLFDNNETLDIEVDVVPLAGAENAAENPHAHH